MIGDLFGHGDQMTKLKNIDVDDLEPGYVKNLFTVGILASSLIGGCGATLVGDQQSIPEHVVTAELKKGHEESIPSSPKERYIAQYITGKTVAVRDQKGAWGVVNRNVFGNPDTYRVATFGSTCLADTPYNILDTYNNITDGGSVEGTVSGITSDGFSGEVGPRAFVVIDSDNPDILSVNLPGSASLVFDGASMQIDLEPASKYTYDVMLGNNCASGISAVNKHVQAKDIPENAHRYPQEITNHSVE